MLEQYETVFTACHEQTLQHFVAAEPTFSGVVAMTTDGEYVNEKSATAHTSANEVMTSAAVCWLHISTTAHAKCLGGSLGHKDDNS